MRPLGTDAGKTAVIYETAAGGSIVGVVPVALATPTTRLDLTLDTNCTAANRY